MPQVKITVKKPTAPRKFSDAFKKQVVQEFEEGRLNKMQLQAKYGIKGDNAVLKWCRKFGKFDYSPKKNATGRPMKDPQQQRIKELEKKLKEAELKLKVYDKLIEITNRELGVDTIKKIEAELSKSWQQKGE
jgi:transposase-like protein